MRIHTPTNHFRLYITFEQAGSLVPRRENIPDYLKIHRGIYV